MKLCNNILPFWEDCYESEEKEVLILMSDSMGSWLQIEGYEGWQFSKDYIAYIDINTNQLIQQEWSIDWYLTNQEYARYNNVDWPYFLQNWHIYRIKVRSYKQSGKSKWALASYWNRFLLIRVLEEIAYHEILSPILKQYRTPIVFTDLICGTFTFNTETKSFHGNATWINHDVSIYLEIDANNIKMRKNVLKTLNTLWSEPTTYDQKFRNYIAEKLIQSANLWQNTHEKSISQTRFAQIIFLESLAILEEGSFIAFFNDSDTFFGHAISLYGNIYTGLEEVSI